MGRKKVDVRPFLDDIERWSYYGVSKREIAQKTGVSYKTFERRLSDDIFVRYAYEHGKKRARRIWAGTH